MKISKTSLPDVHLIDLEPIGDERGYFARFWCYRELDEEGLAFSVAQINTSYTATAGTVRGLHFQHEPHSEAKIISCTGGRVFDVAVDVRPESPTYLQWFGTELAEHDNRLLYVPEGFAHGYQTLEKDSRLLYLVSTFYAPESEGGLRYDDPAIGIDWPLEVTEISQKDAGWPLVELPPPVRPERR